MKNLKNLKVTLSAVVISGFMLIPGSIVAQTGKTNFSGNWAVNVEKSNFGQGQGQPQAQGRPQGQAQGQGQDQGQRLSGFGGGNFIAKQEGNLLTVERSRTNQNGKTTKTESKYTLDGKECVNTTGRGESKSTATWSADGKTLKIVTNSTFTTNGESRKMKSTEEWTLKDARTLSVKTTRASKNGDRVSTIVYDKK